jgi:hypothetical protein
MDFIFSLMKKRNKKIKTSEVFFETYDSLFLPAAKTAALSCLLSASPPHKTLSRFLQKTSKVILNHACINEPWPTKNAGEAMACVREHIFGKTFCFFFGLKNGNRL